VPAAASVAAPRRRTVLLAAPADYVREIIVTTLESAGYPVKLLHDPAGLDPQRDNIQQEVGVAVIDLDVWPGADNVVALRALSETTPVIVVTASTALFLDEPPGNRFQFLPKPFQMSQLIARVDQALGIHTGDV
jgi:DNA-binding response OmpR family regulator